MSKSTKTRQRTQLTRAEIKAYEARRAAEGRRVLVVPEGDAPSSVQTVRRSYTLTRDEEYATIKSDLRRLLLILAALAVALVVFTILLR